MQPLMRIHLTRWLDLRLLEQKAGWSMYTQLHEERAMLPTSVDICFLPSGDAT